MNPSRNNRLAALEHVWKRPCTACTDYPKVIRHGWDDPEPAIDGPALCPDCGRTRRVIVLIVRDGPAVEAGLVGDGEATGAA